MKNYEVVYFDEERKLPPQQENNIIKNNGHVEHGKWKKITNQNYHLLIKEIQSTEFMAYSNNDPHVLIEIHDIGFPRLQQINIESNNITSVENFSRISFPVIDTVWFSCNQVAFLKNLRKCHWPKLKSFGLNKNKFVQAESLMAMDTPHLHKNLIFELSAHDELNCKDISFLCKMKFEKQEESKEEVQIKFLTEGRIPQNKVCQVMKKKNCHLKVYVHQKYGEL